jgi:type IV secretory pathway VirB4 component
MESLHSKKITKPAAGNPTQKFLDIAEIRDDVIVLKNGSFRGILAVSSINYDLKSTEEQDAIIVQYQNFLNSLDFPLQILISSRKLDIDTYLDFIEEKEKEQTNELLKLQTAEYKNFINQLVTVSNIMDKNFYIIVPFSPIENSQKGFFHNILGLLNPQKNTLEKKENFETYTSQLLQRMDHIATGLSGLGIRVAPLKTQELVELLYHSYNSNIFNAEKLGDVKEMDLK